MSWQPFIFGGSGCALRAYADAYLVRDDTLPELLSCALEHNRRSRRTFFRIWVSSSRLEQAQRF